MQLSTQILKPLPSLQHVLMIMLLMLMIKKVIVMMVVMMIVLLVQPHSTFFSRKWETFCFLLSWEPLCRLFKSKSPTTSYQGNKHVFIDKSYDISSVFFFLLLELVPLSMRTISHIIWHNLSSLKGVDFFLLLFFRWSVITNVLKQPSKGGGINTGCQ